MCRKRQVLGGMGFFRSQESVRNITAPGAQSEIVFSPPRSAARSSDTAPPYRVFCSFLANGCLLLRSPWVTHTLQDGQSGPLGAQAPRRSGARSLPAAAGRSRGLRRDISEQAAQRVTRGASCPLLSRPPGVTVALSKVAPMSAPRCGRLRRGRDSPHPEGRRRAATKCGHNLRELPARACNGRLTSVL